jgi:hypothetical protein
MISKLAWHTHKGWLTRAAAVIVLTGLTEALTVYFVPHPLRYLAWISGSLPLTMFLFVAWPLIKAHDQKQG